MPHERILVVDDEEDILELLRYNLTKEDYHVTVAASGEDCLRHVETEPPDLIVLDLMLPGIDGLSVCGQLKGDSRTRPIPIIMLTAKGEEADIVRGLEIGADDYVTKPFSPRVLVARVGAVLRRAPKDGAGESSMIAQGVLSILTERHEARVAGESVELTHTEFQILAFLAMRPGWVFTRFQILEAVRGDNCPVTDRSVDVHIVSLRRKLGEAGTCLETVRGVGYRFREE